MPLSDAIDFLPQFPPWTCIDLHTHSSFSDGTLSPAELYQLALNRKISAVALTDHDTVAGLADFLRAGESGNGQCVAIPGVEISCRFAAKEIHLVGLFIDYKNSQMNNFLEAQRRSRLNRNLSIMHRLVVNGYPLREDEPEFQVADSGSVGRPHFASALMRKYGFSSRQEVFDKLIGRGAVAFVERKLADPGIAIDMIHAAGGIAIWAHPIYRGRNERAFLRRTCKTLVRLGLDGIEAYYSLFGAAETQLVSECASDFDLALSGGSDYHGANSGDIKIGSGKGGLRVPADLLDKLKEKHQKRFFIQ